MKKYILDTDIISYLWDDKSLYHSKIVKHLNNLNDNDIVGISVISIYELTYGVDSFRDEKLKNVFRYALESIKNDNDFQIFALNHNGADFFSHLKTIYKKNTGITAKDAKKNDLDFMIASIVMSEDAILISNDKIFEKLNQIEPNFKLENWIKF